MIRTRAVYITNPLQKGFSWIFLEELMRGKNWTNEIYVIEGLNVRMNYIAMQESMLKGSHATALYVTKQFGRRVVWNIINTSALEKKYIGLLAIYVTKHLHRTLISISII